MLSRSTSIFLLVAAACALAQPALPASAAASPRGLALSAADISHAFGARWKTSLNRTVGNAEARSNLTIPGLGSTSTLITDRVTGYMTGFNRIGAVTVRGRQVIARSGVSAVMSYVNVYKSGASPRVALTHIAHSKLPATVGMTYHMRSLSGVGEGGILVEATWKATRSLPTSYGDIISFRRGRYLGVVSTAWYRTGPSLSDTERLASLMDDRFRAAG